MWLLASVLDSPCLGTKWKSVQISKLIFPLPFTFQGNSGYDGPQGEIGNVGPQVGITAHGMYFTCFCGREQLAGVKIGCFFSKVFISLLCLGVKRKTRPARIEGQCFLEELLLVPYLWHVKSFCLSSRGMLVGLSEAAWGSLGNFHGDLFHEDGKVYMVPLCSLSGLL